MPRKPMNMSSSGYPAKSLNAGTASYKKKVGKQLQKNADYAVKTSTYSPNGTSFFEAAGIAAGYPMSYKDTGWTSKDAKDVRRDEKYRYSRSLGDQVYSGVGAEVKKSVKKSATRPLKKK